MANTPASFAPARRRSLRRLQRLRLEAIGEGIGIANAVAAGEQGDAPFQLPMSSILAMKSDSTAALAVVAFRMGRVAARNAEDMGRVNVPPEARAGRVSLAVAGYFGASTNVVPRARDQRAGRVEVRLLDCRVAVENGLRARAAVGQKQRLRVAHLQGRRDRERHVRHDFEAVLFGVSLAFAMKSNSSRSSSRRRRCG